MWSVWDALRTLGISHDGTPSAEGGFLVCDSPWSHHKKSHITAILSQLYSDKRTNGPQLLTALLILSVAKTSAGVCVRVCVCMLIIMEQTMQGTILACYG